MGRRFVAIAALATSIGLPLAPSAASDQTAAWRVHYYFSTIIWGATSFDLDDRGNYKVATVLAFRVPYTEATGVLSGDAFARFKAAVAVAQPRLWSQRYYSVFSDRSCVEHIAWLQLTLDGAAHRSQWECGLFGPPGDLRELVRLARAETEHLIPRAQTDATEAMEATPVSSHSSFTFETSGVERRYLRIGADGQILGRGRVSRTLYPLADCPPRKLAPADPDRYSRLRAMLTPAETLHPRFSTDSIAIFDEAMSDCPASASGFLSPTWLLPKDVHWILNSWWTHGTGDGATLLMDDSGRYEVSVIGSTLRYGGYDRDVDSWRGVLQPSRLKEIAEAVAASDDLQWSRNYEAVDMGCMTGLAITHVADGSRRAGPTTQIACGSIAAPQNARRLANAALSIIQDLIWERARL